jgi:hypothetical protein
LSRPTARHLGASAAAESLGLLAAAGVVTAAVMVTNVLTGTASPGGASAVLTWAVRIWLLLCLVLTFFVLALIGAATYVRIAKPKQPVRAGRLFGAANLIPGAVALLFVLSVLSALRNFDSGPAWDLGFILAGLGVTLPLAAVALLLGGALGGQVARRKVEAVAERGRPHPTRG